MLNVNPLSLIVRAQQSRLLRWMLGLSGFGLLAVRPNQDPMDRLRIRLMTTLEGLLALALTLLYLLLVGVVALASGSARAISFMLLVGGAVSLAVVVRSMWRSWRNAMPLPGVLHVTALLNLAAVAAAAHLLWRMNRG